MMNRGVGRRKDVDKDFAKMTVEEKAVF